jgi:outer membrane lipoprotein carrier protein
MNILKPLVLFLVLAFPAIASTADEPGKDPVASREVRSPTAEEDVELGQEPSPLDPILLKMDRAYRRIRSYRAEFEQESETQAFESNRKASGRIYYLKPGKMRWTYLQPELREVYMSADKMTIYLPGRNQVIEQTWNDAMPGVAPARLFMGIDELLRSFSVSLKDTGEKEESGAYCLRLAPKDRKSISVEEILLWVGKTDFLPLQSESRDILGNRTRLHFRNGEVNIPLKEELFRFQAPPDAEGIGNSF